MTEASRSSFVLVVVEARVLLVVLAPEVGALLALGDAGADRVALAADLDLALGVGLQVERPGRDLGVAGVGVDHDDVVAVGEVDDRRGALLPGLAPGGGEQQDRRAADLAADPPAAEPVERGVELAGPAQPRGAEGVGDLREGVVAWQARRRVYHGDGRAASLPPLPPKRRTSICSPRRCARTSSCTARSSSAASRAARWSAPSSPTSPPRSKTSPI